MAVPWPATLQQKVSSNSFSFKIGETRLKTEMDIGPAKYRRRFTKSVDQLSTSILLNSITEFNTFYSFFDSDLNGGINEFEIDHPITGVLSSFKFSSPPSITALGGGVFSVSMEWEIVPT
jgi:hypothetical protein